MSRTEKPVQELTLIPQSADEAPAVQRSVPTEQVEALVRAIQEAGVDVPGTEPRIGITIPRFIALTLQWRGEVLAHETAQLQLGFDRVRAAFAAEHQKAVDLQRKLDELVASGGGGGGTTGGVDPRVVEALKAELAAAKKDLQEAQEDRAAIEAVAAAAQEKVTKLEFQVDAAAKTVARLEKTVGLYQVALVQVQGTATAALGGR